MHSSDRFGPSSESPRDRSQLFTPLPPDYVPKLRFYSSVRLEPRFFYGTDPSPASSRRRPVPRQEHLQTCGCNVCGCMRRDNQGQWYWGFCRGYHERCHGGVRGWGEWPFGAVEEEGTVVGEEGELRVETGNEVETGGTVAVIDVWRSGVRDGPLSRVSGRRLGRVQEEEMVMVDRRAMVKSVANSEGSGRSRLTAGILQQLGAFSIRNGGSIRSGSSGQTVVQQPAVAAGPATVVSRAPKAWSQDGFGGIAENRSAAASQTGDSRIAVPEPHHTATRQQTVVSRAPTAWTDDEFTRRAGGRNTGSSQTSRTQTVVQPTATASARAPTARDERADRMDG